MQIPDCFVTAGRTRWLLKAHPLKPEQRIIVDWSTLKHGCSGTKHQRDYLTKSAKEFLCAYALNSKKGSLSSASIPGIFAKIRRLVAWMTRRDIWRFGQLTEHDILDFLAEVSNGGKLSESTFQQYSYLVDRLWALRTEYSGALRVNTAFLARSGAPRLKLTKSTTWKPINEPAALALISDALHWISEMTPVLQTLLETVWKATRKCIGLTHHKKAILLNKMFEEIEQSEGYSILRPLSGVENANPRQVIRRLLALSEGAAAIAMLFLEGMRVSELLSLKACSIESHLHSDGHVYDYLRGVAAKKNGMSRLWIASPQVKIALQSIENLLCGPRSAAKRDWLFVAFSGTTALPLPGRRVFRMTGQTIGKRMRLFADADFRKNRPDCGRLHPHAARKTFARFVVLRDKRALGALAHHYGHVHREYTDTNYVGSDIELAAMMSEENRRDLAEGLSDILQSSNLSGKASKSLRSMVAPNASGKQWRGKKALATAVEKLIEEGVVLAPCDWGYCVYVQSLSACGGDSDGPNSVERSPEVCGGCANFVVTENHRAWWSERVADAADFLKHPGINDQSSAVVHRRKGIAERVLRDLNERARSRGEIHREKG